MSDNGMAAAVAYEHLYLSTRFRDMKNECESSKKRDQWIVVNKEGRLSVVEIGLETGLEHWFGKGISETSRVERWSGVLSAP